MQLKRRPAGKSSTRGTTGSLAAATCALLGTAANQTVVAQELEPWSIDTAMLYYGESDARVQDLSFNAFARKETGEDRFLSLSLAFDTLTGASPNGAVPSATVQTYTRPSGNDSFVVAAGEIPLDDTFQDTRVALSAGWELPISRLSKLNVGASFSDEYDYTHTGINASLARDFNNRNTTLSFGMALANDTINPVGGTPIGLSEMAGEDDLSNKRGDESKDVIDLLVGVTQVINRQSLVQFNYSLSQSDGYLSDPFKILSVIDRETGSPVPAFTDSGLNRYLYEQRPDTRDKQSLFALYKRDIGGDVFDVSYRYMTDDWDITSHTIDMHYRFNFGSAGKYLQPHIRFYSQDAASFYTTVLFADADLPAFASADYRLGKFDAITVGIKYGQRTRSGEINARLELYQQDGSASPGARVGVLSGLSLYPDLTAIIAQLGFRFGS